MTTQQEIDSIVSDRYNNYRGEQMTDLKEIHGVLRKIQGDEEFLKFLKASSELNPRPTFEINKEIFKQHGKEI